ncbi:MAG: hypothetical protein D6698_07420 [Gammaproteobacteria bacterium]|nr:MAG: hypothetical protein D6698_07420 [Gammaproteobacteria bacterium]
MEIEDILQLEEIELPPPHPFFEQHLDQMRSSTYQMEPLTKNNFKAAFAAAYNAYKGYAYSEKETAVACLRRLLSVHDFHFALRRGRSYVGLVHVWGTRWFRPLIMTDGRTATRSVPAILEHMQDLLMQWGLEHYEELSKNPQSSSTKKRQKS